VADMPFMSYQVSHEDALRNAGRLIQEAGAQAVKLEVGAAYAPTVEAVVKAGIPVMAHMGRTPMTTIGSDYRSGSADEAQVIHDAEALETAGAFALLLTGISAELAERITEKAKIPTIAGFGAGDRCDGQIGVTHGVVGFTLEELERPRAAYGPVAVSLFEAAERFTADVRAGKPVRSRQDQSVKDSK
jgi:3-methyl-2-oxobutanoate hydroxymethyltransferase